MAQPLEILPRTKARVDRRNGGTTWDADLGFHLYCVGLGFTEIGSRFGVSARTVCHRADVDGWDAKREMVLKERALVVGKSASKEQEFIRAQECRYARQLMGLAEQGLRHIKPETMTPLDLTRILDMASRLGRLGSGLPLDQIEVTQTYDLGEHLLAAIERAYSTQEPKPINVALPGVNG